MKITIANAEHRCQGATPHFEAKVEAEMETSRLGATAYLAEAFERHQAADWKDGFTAENLPLTEATRLAAAIIWYHGAVPVISAYRRDTTYTVTTPGYAAW